MKEVWFYHLNLFADSEKAYNLSKPYLDVLYKTLEEVEKAQKQVLEQRQNQNQIKDNQE